MKRLSIKMGLTLLMSFSAFFCSGQRSDKVIIHTENCNHLIAGIDNYISIIVMQDSALSVEQVSAFLITPNSYFQESQPVKIEVEKKYGKFKIHPDSIGMVEFHIRIKENIEIATIRVKPLTAVCRFSKYQANSEAKIPIAEFKAQKGIISYVECCGFDATCKTIAFEVLRIPSDELLSKTTNTGGRFEEATLHLIQQAKSGDLYIFRNIYYQCPSTEKQRSEDMIFEIE